MSVSAGEGVTTLVEALERVFVSMAPNAFGIRQKDENDRSRDDAIARRFMVW